VAGGTEEAYETTVKITVHFNQDLQNVKQD
jgi:hypothetical protein